MVLRQLGARLSQGYRDEDEGVRSLYKQFYEALPHREEHRKEGGWSLQDVVARQDLCQVGYSVLNIS